MGRKKKSPFDKEGCINNQINPNSCQNKTKYKDVSGSVTYLIMLKDSILTVKLSSFQLGKPEKKLQDKQKYKLESKKSVWKQQYIINQVCKINR